MHDTPTPQPATPPLAVATLAINQIRNGLKIIQQSRKSGHSNGASTIATVCLANLDDLQAAIADRTEGRT